MTARNLMVSLYVDRVNQQWVVRDPDGNYWVIPPADDAWSQRRPFQRTDEAELEPVPGHYKSLLGLPL